MNTMQIPNNYVDNSPGTMTHGKTYDRLWNMLTRWPSSVVLDKWSPLIYSKICGSIRRRFEMSHGDGRFSRDKIQHSAVRWPR